MMETATFREGRFNFDELLIQKENHQTWNMFRYMPIWGIKRNISYHFYCRKRRLMDKGPEDAGLSSSNPSLILF